MHCIIVSNSMNPYLNIAVENYLLSHCEEGRVVMYLWRNDRTVVIGRNQNPYAECDVERLESDGGSLMRRGTGGGAVYHDGGNLNFSFIVPYSSYDVGRQLGVMQQAVATFGLDTEVSGRNDVLCQGRKFSGNAFAKGSKGRLHHGTILIKTDVQALQRYLIAKPAKLQRHGVASVQSRVVNLSELQPAITAEGLIPRLVEAFEQSYGKVETLNFDNIASLPEVGSLYDKYSSEEWKYGGWREFSAQFSHHFDWGGVDIALTVDEPTSTFAKVQIASDSLFPETIARATQLLQGASSVTPPSIVDEQNPHILNDIFTLIYEKK